MSVEDRLFTLVDQCRQQQGDGFIQSPALFVPRLSSQAPDLHAEIKALGAALEMNAAGRIENATDSSNEAEQIKNEIAVKEKLSAGVVAAALNVARRIGSLSAVGTSPAGDGWAGDSVVVGTPATPQYQQPQSAQPGHTAGDQYEEEDDDDDEEEEKPPIWKDKRVIAGAVIALVAVLYFSQQQGGGQQPGPQPAPQPIPQPGPQPMPQPGPQPMPQPGPQPVPQPGPQPVPQQTLPLLQPPNGQLPTLQVQQLQNGSLGISFTMTTQAGQSPAMVMLPAGSWDGGEGLLGIWRPGVDYNTNRPDSLGSGYMLPFNNNGVPVRALIPVWQQDNMGFGSICVAFMGSTGQDVQLRGSTMCVMDGNCERASGCGRIQ